MSDEMRPDEEEVIVPVEAKPKKKKAPREKEIHLSLDQYFNTSHPEVHAYTRAYVGAGYRGIIKTIKEWDDVLKDKL